MRKWILRHKWGLSFEYKPDHQSVYACMDFNGVGAWTEFSCDGDYKAAAKWLRKVADRLDALHTAQGKEASR